MKDIISQITLIAKNLKLATTIYLLLSSRSHIMEIKSDEEPHCWITDIE